jgi:hypothetical protein
MKVEVRPDLQLVIELDDFAAAAGHKYSPPMA